MIGQKWVGPGGAGESEHILAAAQEGQGRGRVNWDLPREGKEDQGSW